MQAFKMATPMTIAAPGGTSTRVIRPPDDMPPDSKRAELIEHAEDDLENEMDVLKEGTRARNLEIEKRLEEIEQMGVHWEEQLRREIKRRDDAHAETMKAFEANFNQLGEGFQRDIKTTFDVLENDKFPIEASREIQLRSDFRHFVDITVPGIIEQLQGSVTRQLKKSHETFAIDNIKLMKRERKIVDRFEHIEKTTKHAFEVEIKKRQAKFVSLNEDVNDTIRTDDRQAERTQNVTISSIIAAQEEFATEQQVREREDLEILEKLAQAMARLQGSILTNFGEQSNV